ncbi:MAG: hypothetical protein RKK15_09970 [Defluviicoccus sp.]|nr:hypothetical protein [Defluviicoccus sp.]
MTNVCNRERVLVLVKALPHAGERHGETVCCAGVTESGEWRRQFPIHFRTLEQKFRRWQWIDYEWLKPKDDHRPESRRVQEHTIVGRSEMPERERAGFLAPLILPSTEAAAAKGQTLALIRPRNVRFGYKKKKPQEIATERQAYASAARQGSFFVKTLTALEPCPYEFRFEYESEDGKPHSNVCDDWETGAMFYKFRERYGEAQALRLMDRTFNHDYPTKGMALALGTHSRYPGTWLLVGVIRLDMISQMTLDL